jgi:hypothetical protein
MAGSVVVRVAALHLGEDKVGRASVRLQIYLEGKNGNETDPVEIWAPLDTEGSYVAGVEFAYTTVLDGLFRELQKLKKEDR